FFPHIESRVHTINKEIKIYKPGKKFQLNSYSAIYNFVLQYFDYQKYPEDDVESFRSSWNSIKNDIDFLAAMDKIPPKFLVFLFGNLWKLPKEVFYKTYKI